MLSFLYARKSVSKRVNFKTGKSLFTIQWQRIFSISVSPPLVSMPFTTWVPHHRHKPYATENNHDRIRQAGSFSFASPVFTFRWQFFSFYSRFDFGWCCCCCHISFEVCVSRKARHAILTTIDNGHDDDADDSE